MQGSRLIFAIVFAALILILAIIHLGVSISIVVKVRNYGDVFRPERGLAVFNIIISIFALIVGGFALFALLTDRGILARITGYVSAVLAVFAFASLIAALSINSLAINYTTSRFDNHLVTYQTSQDSRNIIDQIQTKYDCCGTDTWLDWSEAGLNATAPATNNTLTTTQSSNTTTIADGITTTAGGTTGGAGTTAQAVSTTSTASSLGGITSSTAGTTTINAGTGQGTRRRKRQAQSEYGGVVGLPTSFAVTLPQSCCTNQLSATDNLRNLYCISNTNGTSDTIHLDGCSKKLGKFAVGQTLGLAVINSFLVVASLALISLVIGSDSHNDHQQTGHNDHQHTGHNGGQNMPYQQPMAPQYYPPQDQYQYPASYGNYGPASYDNYGPASYSYS